MQQKLPKSAKLAQTSPQDNSEDRAMAKLEAEIRQNQRRIEQLHQRNTQLNHQRAAIEQQYHRQPISMRAASTATKTTKSRPILPKLRISRAGISVGLIIICVAIICGTIGYAITRLVAVK